MIKTESEWFTWDDQEGMPDNEEEELLIDFDGEIITGCWYVDGYENGFFRQTLGGSFLHSLDPSRVKAWCLYPKSKDINYDRN